MRDLYALTKIIPSCVSLLQYRSHSEVPRVLSSSANSHKITEHVGGKKSFIRARKEIYMEECFLFSWRVLFGAFGGRTVWLIIFEAEFSLV